MDPDYINVDLLYLECGLNFGQKKRITNTIMGE